MATQNRKFRGIWIPGEIWFEKSLNPIEKIILVEIDSLDQSENGCWATNKHIAELCQCSETTVSKSISKLVKLGYLEVKAFNGRSRFLKSRLSNFEKQFSENSTADFQKLKQSNTSNNQINNTKKRDVSAKRQPFAPPTLEEIEIYCQERNSSVDPYRFFDYFTASDWYDSNGKKVVSWKQKIIAWERHQTPQSTTGKNGIAINITPSKLDKLF